MESDMKKLQQWKEIVIGVLMLAGLAAAMVVRSETKNSGRAQAQATFESPAEAGAALANAARNVNQAEVDKIVGAGTRFLLSTGNRQADQAALQRFATKYDKMNRWVDMTDGSAVLYVGVDNFAFPVPLAKNAAGKWYFDAVAGAEEVRARDIGRNELLAIDACSALAGAQQDYFARGDSGEYAQRIISSSGKRDGLYWPAGEQENSSPLANLSEFPRSSLTAFSPNQPLTIDGYTLRILTAQGKDAPGGAKHYVVNGKMTGGFALLATPVKYGETGIMTFMTGRDGVVYERDFGPDTATIAAYIQEFNPTDDWSPVE
jgi:hypothetical protein